MMCREIAALLTALLLVPGARAITQEWYTTNMACKQNFCINPVFPGISVLQEQQLVRWRKYDNADVASYLSFCKPHVVDYDPALPIQDIKKGGPNTTLTMEDLVRKQELAAAQLYYFHLAGMGVEPWEHQYPEEPSPLPMRPCVRTIARMACFTYFPMGNPVMPRGAETRYFKPCKSSCENFVKTCEVECCDNSVQCTFTETDALSGLQVDAGFYDALGPSDMCTGAAWPQHTAAWAVLLGCLVFALHF
mmetsp:Transcript_144151/g.249957  ORF Transcript_144151/g.249957 Transcript_144151/m.249957 type:complete len:249 (+) Transcript_144151:134-880(+)